MTLLRRISYATLFLAFAQIVFGAIVRITGSGLGCGDHWPKCYDRWFPPFDRVDLIIEVTHRYIAFFLLVAIVSLFIVAWKQRHEVYARVNKSVVAPAAASLLLVLSAAILGAVTVKLDLHHNVVVVHKTLAILLLGTLAVVTVRAGGFGAYSLAGSHPPTYQLGIRKSLASSKGAVILALLVVILGAFTANVAGANGSCQGFPLCRAVLTPGAPLHIHLTHRILAFLLFFHTTIAALLSMRRPQPALLRRAALLTAFIVFVQLLVAAMLVETHLPPTMKSIHQGVGALIWLAVVISASLASIANRFSIRSN